MLGQHRQLTDDLRQFAIAGGVESESDLAIRGLLHLGHVAIVGGELRTVFLESSEGEDHVFRSDRLAVMPSRFRPQPVGGGGEILGVAHRFGDKSVFGGHLVSRGRHQGVVDERNAAGDRAFDARNHGIEIVEGADSNLAHDAAFRRFGVDVFELLEAGRIFQVSE